MKSLYNELSFATIGDRIEVGIENAVVEDVESWVDDNLQRILPVVDSIGERTYSHIELKLYLEDTVL